MKIITEIFNIGWNLETRLLLAFTLRQMLQSLLSSSLSLSLSLSSIYCCYDNDNSNRHHHQHNYDYHHIHDHDYDHDCHHHHHHHYIFILIIMITIVSRIIRLHSVCNEYVMLCHIQNNSLERKEGKNKIAIMKISDSKKEGWRKK